VPNIKSAIKRVKISEARTIRNASAKSALRTTIRKFEGAIVSNDVEKLLPLLRLATRSLDKAASKGIIHRNAAARRKSRLMKRYNKTTTA